MSEKAPLDGVQARNDPRESLSTHTTTQQLTRSQHPYSVSDQTNVVALTHKKIYRHTHIYIDIQLMVPSHTLDRQTLDTTNPRQANARHDKP